MAQHAPLVASARAVDTATAVGMRAPRSGDEVSPVTF